jgi:hypothetical protein
MVNFDVGVARYGWMSDYASLIRPTMVNLDGGGVAGVSDYALRANPTYGGEFGWWGSRYGWVSDYASLIRPTGRRVMWM